MNALLRRVLSNNRSVMKDFESKGILSANNSTTEYPYIDLPYSNYTDVIVYANAYNTSYITVNIWGYGISLINDSNENEGGLGRRYTLGWAWLTKLTNTSGFVFSKSMTGDNLAIYSSGDMPGVGGYGKDSPTNVSLSEFSSNTVRITKINRIGSYSGYGGDVYILAR